MSSALPIAPAPGGRTFPMALAVLALVGGAQALYLLRHAGHPGAVAPEPTIALQVAAPTPALPSTTAPPLAAEQEIVTAEAEKQLLAALPRPTPVPARRDTPLSRVGTLVSMARALRDRGDTSTALTRLREAQIIAPKDSQIISEMALTYEKMGLTEKAATQWQRIYEMGEQAGIYYAAAEAKLYALQMPPPATQEYAASAEPASLWPQHGLMGETGEATLRLGKVGTTDDTGNSQALRRLKLRIPIEARAAQEVAVQDVVIQVFFYDRLSDGMLVETNAEVASQWVRRTTPEGEEAGIDWSTPAPEVLEVEYAQIPATPGQGEKESSVRRNYFGYVVRVYYKGELNAVQAEPARLLEQFPPPPILQPADFPQ